MKLSEEPPGVKSVGVDKRPIEYYPVSPCSLFGNTFRTGQKETGIILLFGIHRSGCYRPDYLLVGNGDA